MEYCDKANLVFLSDLAFHFNDVIDILTFLAEREGLGGASNVKPCPSCREEYVAIFQNSTVGLAWLPVRVAGRSLRAAPDVFPLGDTVSQPDPITSPAPRIDGTQKLEDVVGLNRKN